MMELGLGQGWRGAAALVILLVVGSCLEGTQGTSPPYVPVPRPPSPGIYLPYFCPSDVTLTKLRFKQGESDGYIQYTEYVTEIPALSSFTLHYWFILEDTTNTSTLFNYGTNLPKQSDLLTVQLKEGSIPYVGRFQYFQVYMVGAEDVRVMIQPLIKAGQWYHALHTWDSNTGLISHYLNGVHLNTHQISFYKDVVIPGGGIALSGQHRNTLHNGMDQGEGLNGWFTLLQLSAKPLGNAPSSAANTKAKLAYQCSTDMEGDVISWSKTPRKGYGGVTETPSFSKACGQF